MNGTKISYEDRTRKHDPRGRQPVRYAAYVEPRVRNAATVPCLSIIVQEITDGGTRKGWRATGTGLDGNYYAFSVGRTRDDAVEGLLTRGVQIEKDER